MIADNESIKKFIEACQKHLDRAENVINEPQQLITELENFDEFVKGTWPSLAEKINESAMTPPNMSEAKKIFQRIKKLELIAKSRTKILDGMAAYMERAK
ncbi:MAG: hypothetical protein VYE27_04020 [Pseudomonadota bacterium]|nr:hypothetical protein [Pseudomonadota bacterium]